MNIVLILGLVLCYAALVMIVLVVLAPVRIRRSLLADSRAGEADAPGRAWLRDVESNVERILGRTTVARLAVALDQAGMKTKPANLVLVTAIGAVAVALLALIISAPILALAALVAAPIVAKLTLRYQTGKRQKTFALQLDDTLQLLAGSLRAGHSLLRSIDAVANQTEAPTSQEFGRAVNEIRLGRDMGAALGHIGERMSSEDFIWVVQAIDIHRDVGGNLAEVLDQVGQTIRERNKLRQDVQSLSADGRISAYVLMGLPVGLAVILTVMNPGYLAPFVTSMVGWVLTGISVLMFVAGGLWLRKIINISL